MFYLPNNHASAFFMGMLMGFVTRRYPNVYLGGKVGETMIWCVTWSMTIFSLIWHNNFWEKEPTQLNLHLYLAFGKLFWISGWAWLVFACSTGRAGKLNEREKVNPNLFYSTLFLF